MLTTWICLHYDEYQLVIDARILSIILSMRQTCLYFVRAQRIGTVASIQETTLTLTHGGTFKGPSVLMYIYPARPHPSPRQLHPLSHPSPPTHLILYRQTQRITVMLGFARIAKTLILKKPRRVKARTQVLPEEGSGLRLVDLVEGSPYATVVEGSP